MLELINITKKFGNFTAVENLNLKINAGDFFGFMDKTVPVKQPLSR